MQLNELDKSMEGVIPPTDSRLRPDIRAMENGDIGRVSDLGEWFESVIPHQLKFHAQISASMFYRSGKCREEEAWGKTENGPEKSHQVNRGMENKVSYWEMWSNVTAQLMILVFTKCLPIVLCYPLCLLLYYNYRNAPLGPRFGSKLFLFGYCLLWCEMLPYSTLLRTECTTATMCLELEAFVNTELLKDTSVWYNKVCLNKKD